MRTAFNRFSKVTIVMRFLKRRKPSDRPAVNPEGIIIFQSTSANWRKHVQTLKAVQQSAQEEADFTEIDLTEPRPVTRRSTGGKPSGVS